MVSSSLTTRQWFALGNLAKLPRDEFVTGFEVSAERAVLAHPPHRLPADSLQAATPVEGLVTVIVPTLNEEAAIDECLRTIREQSYPRLEILVLDGRSHDTTRAIVADHAIDDERIRLIDNPDRVIPAALNRAIWAASGQWLVRVDAHATIPTDYVERLVDHLVTGRWGGVGGRKDGTSSEPMGRAIAVALGSPFGVGNSVYHHGTTIQVVDHLAYGAYPSEVARSIGGWNERLVANEDYEFDPPLSEKPVTSYSSIRPSRFVGSASSGSAVWVGSTDATAGRRPRSSRSGPNRPRSAIWWPRRWSGWTAAAALASLRHPRLGAAMMAPDACRGCGPPRRTRLGRFPPVWPFGLRPRS